jgi:hypothetical protein
MDRNWWCKWSRVRAIYPDSEVERPRPAAGELAASELQDRSDIPLAVA